MNTEQFVLEIVGFEYDSAIARFCRSLFFCYQI